jgi:uncharacterized protein (TIGR02231 family)
MRTSLKLLVLAAVSVLPFRAVSAPPAPAEGRDDAKTVVSAITDVTVYADRSRVTRAAAVTLPAGTVRFSFSGLPGWIDEGSVRVALNPAASGRIADVQVIRTFLAQPADDEVRKLEAGITEIQDQLAALDDELGPLEAQEQQVRAIRAFTTEKWTKETVVREVKTEEYGGMVKFIGGSLAEIAKAKRGIEKQKRALQPELAARQRKLADLRQCMQLEQRTVVVTVSAANPASATLTLTYMLPGTTWEPVHELRASQDGNAVEMASYAVVSQTTGEDWTGVNLTLSTQRPMAAVHIPELESLAVGAGRPLARLVNANGDGTFDEARKNWSAQNQAFNGTVLTGANTYSGTTKIGSGTLQISSSDYSGNVVRQSAVQQKVVAVFERVQQQRGTTAQFTAPGAQTVRTDGRSVRVPIGTVRLAAAPKIVAAPELSLNAVQTVDLTNGGAQPFLPGKVSIFLDGALVGTTEVEFVAPGEGFAMFLGVVDRVKLSRTLDKKSSSLTWSGKRKKMQTSFLVTVENLSDRPVTLQLADRIPVSDNDDIRVSGVRVQPEVKPDAKGLLKWDVTLAAKEKREFRLEYMLTYPQDLQVVPLKDGDNAPAMELNKQIRDLESKF